MISSKRMTAQILANEDSLLDEKILSELVDLVGEESMARMLQVFLTELKERLAILNEIYLWINKESEGYDKSDGSKHRNIDFKEIEIQAHTLKSCAGSFGASALFEAVKQLENAAKSEDLAFVIENILKVEKFGQLSKESLKQRFMMSK
ncbi:Hpt domain-containing protein [Shewanella surugensis]|uniref:Hpt domain-containing protein n=1 Tax=Shewanella surugensis TaxID=212020 RepID=A0ABT0LB45_9GAMM|nr:Hpt domain-containing protein [Shewanella surugensis]MCL1124916.1 Hpt domain-containing protein [Shewanella surugensis]